MTSAGPGTGPLVHGMGTELVPASWPALTEPECATVLARYDGLSGAVGIEWTSPRPLSAAAIVVVNAERVFVKRHLRAVRSVSDLLEEHRFLEHLSTSIPVPLVLRDRQGNSAYSAGDWTYEVHSVVAGSDSYRDEVSWTPLHSTEHALAAGRMLGRLHRASADYAAPARATEHLVARFDVLADSDPMHRLEQMVASRPLLHEALAGRDWRSEVAEQILPRHATLAPYLSELAPLWTHNDWHGSNLLWQADGEVAAVIDVGLANRTTAIFDLATALERNTIGWLGLGPGGGGTASVHLDQARALLIGYLSLRALSEAERRALPLLLPIVHVEFALSELEYFAGIVSAPADAELAYQTFLLGHCRWFSGDSGRAYLQSLEQHLSG